MSNQRDPVSYSLTLTHMQLGILLDASGRRPAKIRMGHALRELIDLRFVEENPTGPGFYRCTELGEKYLAPFLRRV